MSFIVWEGVFDTFRNAKAHNAEKTSTDIFTSPRWLDITLAKTKEALKEGAIRTGAVVRNDLLPGLAAQVANAKDCVRILDFGGAMGASVPRFLGSLPPGTEAEITIIDNTESCALGRGLFLDEPRVIFTETFPQHKQSFDIVHCESSLHFVDDWRQALKTLAGYEADHLMFSELPAGEIPSFVSLQVYYEHLLPTRFWNIGEFVSAVEELGYNLNSQTEHDPIIRGMTGPSPMGNFPEEYRLEHFCHLGFSARRGVLECK